ncbi:MAG: ABC transporter transmembrane domain-containing protein [Candidatus Lokiarchaeota archaeon]|nr:ABC transporter transmembrane domain-containing protein [Candidatus Lokiarchaeota archaeon]
MSSNDKKEKEEEKEIIQPGVGMRHGFMMDSGKSKLEHPRSELWKWLFSYLGRYKLKFLTFLILLLVGTLVTSVSPIISANIIDYGIVAEDSYYIIIMSTFYFSLLVFMAITTYFAQYGMGKISQKITFEIRNDLFYKLQDMSLSYFDKRSSGDIMSITTNDVTQLNQLVGGQFVSIISSVVGLILTIFIMFILNPYLALISLVIFPIFFFFTYLFRKVAMGLFKESRKTIGKVTSSIQENIAGAKVVQAYGQEKKASTEFDQANTANYNAMLKIRRFMATIFPLITLITTMLTAGILLAGGFAVLGNVSVFGITVTVGVLSAYISILGQFFRPFMTLMQIQEMIASALAASDRIYSLLEETVEIPDIENPKPLENVIGEIRFDSVDFGYSLENGEAINLKQELPQTSSQDISPPGLLGRPDLSNNPMMKRAMDFMKALPEPYSSFMMENIQLMPQNIRQKLFMSMMGQDPSKAPKLIDAILGEFNYAVPGTEIADNHPELKTSFKQAGKKADQEDSSPIPALPPEAILQMTKVIEKNLKSKAKIPSSGGEMGEGGGMMGGGMPQMSPQTMLRMLATIKIKKEVYDQIPKIVREALDEEKKIIQHEQSKGYVLKNVNLDISSGKTIAIVGETGAGKTTITKLISRFYDVNNGKITLDNIDIREISKKNLRNLIGLVPQDAFLFTGTIKENLLYAFDNPTPEIEKKMIEVSKFLSLHNFIETLHKKYDTKLKENASNISIGQRQLIAFARALITDPKILILDEATSSVDPYTETLIQDALDKARHGRTTIIIAHRLSTIKNADHIIILSADKKGILEQGTHDSLLELNGKYKRLLEMQHRDI